MTDSMNPQIETTLDELAGLICRSLQGSDSDLDRRRDPLLKTLVMSGYIAQADQNLMQEIENRVKDQCREPAMHRGGTLSSMTRELGNRLEEIVRWESKTPTESKSPGDQSPPKAANLSSATDA